MRIVLAIAAALALMSCGQAPTQEGASNEQAGAGQVSAQAAATAEQPTGAAAQPPQGVRMALYGFTIGMTEAQMQQRVAADGWRQDGEARALTQNFSSIAGDYLSRDARSITFLNAEGTERVRFYLWPRRDGAPEVYAMTWWPFQADALPPDTPNRSFGEPSPAHRAVIEKITAMFGGSVSTFGNDGRILLGPDQRPDLGSPCQYEVNGIVVTHRCGFTVLPIFGQSVPAVHVTNGPAVDWLLSQTR